jgi:hypothetical protein
MAEFTRTLVSRLRQYVGDRRHSTRRSASLKFSLSLASPANALNGSRRVNSMTGHTRDVSERGLALIVPVITLGDHHLVGENRSLNISLELPDGAVLMQVIPVRYERLDEQASETGYLLGVKITTIQAEDRVRFEEYVASL